MESVQKLISRHKKVVALRRGYFEGIISNKDCLEAVILAEEIISPSNKSDIKVIFNGINDEEKNEI